MDNSGARSRGASGDGGRTTRLAGYEGLPPASSARAVRQVLAKETLLATIRKKKVLVVEDDTDIRTIMLHLLGDKYDLVLSEDGRSGMEKALSERPDLILLDNYMAGMSGFEVCKAIRNTPEIASVPIIIVTAGALKEEVAEGYSLGADDYVLKPFDPEDLIERMEKHLRSRV